MCSIVQSALAPTLPGLRCLARLMSRSGKSIHRNMCSSVWIRPVRPAKSPAHEDGSSASRLPCYGRASASCRPPRAEQTSDHVPLGKEALLCRATSASASPPRPGSTPSMSASLQPSATRQAPRSLRAPDHACRAPGRPDRPRLAASPGGRRSSPARPPRQTAGYWTKARRACRARRPGEGR